MATSIWIAVLPWFTISRLFPNNITKYSGARYNVTTALRVKALSFVATMGSYGRIGTIDAFIVSK